MRKYLSLLIVILLAVLIFFQYKKYRRFRPPEDYAFNISEEIDPHYFDPEVVQTYYRSAQEIGSYARGMWFSEGIDVKYPDYDDVESQEAVRHYNRLIGHTQYLEELLKTSGELKGLGFNNAEIRRIVEEGLSPAQVKEEKAFEGFGKLQKNDEGKKVWELQNALVAKGYEMPVDGDFQDETVKGLKAYQEKEGLYPSGMLDFDTWQKLKLNK